MTSRRGISRASSSLPSGFASRSIDGRILFWLAQPQNSDFERLPFRPEGACRLDGASPHRFRGEWEWWGGVKHIASFSLGRASLLATIAQWCRVLRFLKRKSRDGFRGNGIGRREGASLEGYEGG